MTLIQILGKQVVHHPPSRLTAPAPAAHRVGCADSRKVAVAILRAAGCSP